MNAKVCGVLFSVIITVILGSPTISHSQTTEPLSTYTDPEGRFSIQYPSGWEVTPAENRFETIVVELSNPDMPFGQVQAIDVRILEDIGDPLDLAGDFSSLVSLSLSSVSGQTPQFAIEEDVECEKYSLAGAEETCSVIYSRGLDFTSDIKAAVFQVAGLSGDSAYLVTYTSTLNEFDKNLPQAEQIINTFRISGGEEDTADEDNAEDEDNEEGNEDNTNIFN